MPEPAFTGFPHATFTWFAGLEADNSTAWFAAHRETYDNAVRGELETWGEALKTAPRGFPRDHPRVTLLRHKLLIAGRRLEPRGRSGLARDATLQFTRDTWAACVSMTTWLDQHVGVSALPPAPRR